MRKTPKNREHKARKRSRKTERRRKTQSIQSHVLINSESRDSDGGEHDDIKQYYWWLAVNGASCAASSLPLPPTVVVSPTPERLFGFRTRGEQIEAQSYMLTAPIEDVQQYMVVEILKRIRDGEVVCIQPDKPEAPREQTIWMVGPSGE